MLQSQVPACDSSLWTQPGRIQAKAVKSSSYARQVPSHRKWTVLLLAVLFLATASQQAMHAHRMSPPASKQMSDRLDSNAVAHCPVCLHSQAARLGSAAVCVSPHVAVEASPPAGPLEAHSTGEQRILRVRPPPSA